MPPDAAFDEPPEPGNARTPEDLVAQLRLLRVWAGSPSYARVAHRVNEAWRSAGRPAREWTTAKATVADCFTVRPRGPNDDLLLAIVEVLNPEASYLARWRQAVRIVRGEADAASLVSALDRLPEGIDAFTGRAAELDELTALLDTTTAEAGLVTSAIEGMPGVGKTALAIHAAHQVVQPDRFDRVLVADLRAFHPDPRQPPADPAAVLAEFLRLLGTAGDQIPQHRDPHVALERRAQRYRELVRNQRVLVVLDNAADTEQVRHLVPFGPRCRTLVTSRRSLAGLAAAHHMVLDVFAPDEAVHLIHTVAGNERFTADPAAAALIARLVGYLPLALGVLANQIRTRDWPLAEHLERLLNRFPHRDTDRLLRDPVELAITLRLEDRVKLALCLSYDDLAPVPRRMFRLLALHPGHDADAYAAAALADLDLPAAVAALDDLLAANLLRRQVLGRYVMHDVIRAYAMDRTQQEDPGNARRAAQERLFDHYRYVASNAVDLLIPTEAERRPRSATPSTPAPDLTDSAQALAWLDAERPNLIAVAAYAADRGWHRHTGDLSITLFRYLDAGAHWRDAEILHAAALRCADRATVRHALSNLAGTLWKLARYDEALAHLQRVLVLTREDGDRAAEGRALSNLGGLYGALGHYQQAVDHLRQALAFTRETGDRQSEGRTLGNLGNVYRRLGRYREALDHHRDALKIFREAGNWLGESIALRGVARVQWYLGQYQQALDRLNQAMAIAAEAGDRDSVTGIQVEVAHVYRLMGRCDEARDLLRPTLPTMRETGNRAGEGVVLNELGLVYQRLGHTREALEHQRQALAIARELGDRPTEAEMLNDLGETLHHENRVEQALEHHRRALTLGGDIDEPYEVARAHSGIARAQATLYDQDAAQTHGARALEIFTDLGVAAADQVRAFLAALDQR